MLEPDPREIRLTRTGRISKALKGQAVHRCEQCGKVYTRLEHLRRHQRNHGTILRCEIDGCDKVFHRHDMLERHRENGHKVLPNRKRLFPRPSDDELQQQYASYAQPLEHHDAHTPTAPYMSSATPASATTSPTLTDGPAPTAVAASQPQRPHLTLSTAPAAARLPSIQSLLNDEAPISPVLPPPTGAWKSPMSAAPFGNDPASPAMLEHPQSAFPSPGPYYTSHSGPTPSSARRPFQYPPPPPPPPAPQPSHSPEGPSKLLTPKSAYPPHPAPRPGEWKGHHASRSMQLQGSPAPTPLLQTESPPAKRARLSEERKRHSSPGPPPARDENHVNDVLEHISRRWAPQALR